jgi:hypothetical protein
VLNILACIAVLLVSSPVIAAQVCDAQGGWSTRSISVKSEVTIDVFIGTIVEVYEDEGRGDPKKYRHLYLLMPETICFVSADEDRAAALNAVQLDYDRAHAPKALLKHGSLMSIKGKVIAAHVGHGFSTPYIVEIVEARKLQ